MIEPEPGCSPALNRYDMFPILYKTSQEWPQSGSLKVRLPALSVEITVPPEVAIRRANAYLGLEVGVLIAAEAPTLLVSERPVWRLTAALHMPHTGRIGEVGFIDVDAQTGETVSLSEEQIATLQDRAAALARRFAPETAPSV